MLGNLGLKYWVKWKGGGVVKYERQIITDDFLFMINVFNPVLLKRMLDAICSVLHHKVFGCYFAMQHHSLGFQSFGSL
jgi:hypothetical protein